MTGDNIKRLRMIKGWSQQELADRMGYKHRSTIGKIETGTNDVTQATVVRFADVFGVSVKDILGDDFLESDYIVTDSTVSYIVEATKRMSERDKMALMKYAQFLVGDDNA